MSKESLQIGVTTNVTITDDLGNMLLNKSNAIHPQNMSRVIARALANEPNSSIYRLALGRGGTFIDATGDISYRRPNDGIAPDVAGYASRLYDETYYEIVDEGSAFLGTGMGTNPNGDGAGVAGVHSVKLPTGESQVIITCVLNSKEPNSQLSNSLTTSSINGPFVFDELGLFTAGLPLIATSGYQDVFFGTAGKTSTDLTFLDRPDSYCFRIVVDGKTFNVGVDPDVTYGTPPAPFTIPLAGTGAGGEITYGDLVGYLNTYFRDNNMGVVAQISQPGLNTLGALRFRSLTAGSTINASGEIEQSHVIVENPSSNPPTNWLFNRIKQSTSGATAFSGFGAPVYGEDEGDEDNSAAPDREVDRMLTHLIFSPLQKDATRSWKITYKLTIVVMQTESHTS